MQMLLGREIYAQRYQIKGMSTSYLAKKYMLKVNNRSIRKRCEIYSKLRDVVLVSLLLVSIIDFGQVNVCRDMFKVSNETT